MRKANAANMNAEQKAAAEERHEQARARANAENVPQKIRPDVKAYCVRGFRLGGNNGAVNPGEVVKMSNSDFFALEHLGKVIYAKDAPKPKSAKPGKK